MRAHSLGYLTFTKPFVASLGAKSWVHIPCGSRGGAAEPRPLPPHQPGRQLAPCFIYKADTATPNIQVRLSFLLRRSFQVKAGLQIRIHIIWKSGFATKQKSWSGSGLAFQCRNCGGGSKWSHGWPWTLTMEAWKLQMVRYGNFRLRLVDR